jgi:hypothetical protein
VSRIAQVRRGFEMNKRELKKALKAYAIRQLWFRKETLESFEVMNSLRTDRQKERVQEVIIEIMKEWK